MNYSRLAVPVLALTLLAATPRPTINLLGRQYRLASFNQTGNPTWEFTTGLETIENWTTIITLIDWPDAKSRADLDRLGQGIVDQYKSNGGQILNLRTMKGESGDIFNYVLAAIEQPAQHRFEINFIKIALRPRNAYMAIYGVRITDPKNYKTKAKAYLEQHAGDVGLAVGTASFPDPGTLPRQPGPYHP